MKLHIVDSNNIVDRKFGLWLINYIKVRLLSSLSSVDLSRWNNYLNTSVTTIGKKHYDVYKLFEFASNNLVCSGEVGDITIELNNKIYVPTFDRLKLSVIMKTINYGTLNIKSSPVLLNTLNYFADNIDTYLQIYYNL